MPARTNKRVIYAHQALLIKPLGSTNTSLSSMLASEHVVFGAQDIGISTNFSNTPYFELGQLEIYEDVEELPDIEVTVSKALDGRPLIYHLATSNDAITSPTLAGRQNVSCLLTLGIYPDTNDYSTGTPPSAVQCSGLFPSSLSYSFPVDGTFTESVTLVGNDKLWKNDTDIVNTTDLARSTGITLGLTTELQNDLPSQQGTVTISGAAYNFISSGVQRRQHLNFTPWSFYNYTGSKPVDVNGMAADPFCTILPPDVDGISTSGTNNKSDGTNFDAHVQNITVSVDLGRDQLNELGRRGPYHRFIQFPVEVTTSIEVITTSGDMVSATEGGIRSTSQAACQLQTNLQNRTIRVATCHKEIFYLGTKNKLTSVTYGGGGTDGGNTTVTYNYRNYNTLTVMAFADPHELVEYAIGGSVEGADTEFWNTTFSGGIAGTGINYTPAQYIPGGYYLVNFT